MNNNQSIAEGRTADLFPISDQQVIKVLKPGFSSDWLETEYRICQFINKVGVPTPLVHGIKTVGGRTGLVFERIDGHPLFNLIEQAPQQIKRVGVVMAELHAMIHSKQAMGITSQKLKLKENIDAVPSDLLLEETKNLILTALNRQSEGSRLCHGDFHPLNILVRSNEEFAVIDWVTATSGQPACDVARTLFMLNHAELPDDIPEDFLHHFQQFRKQLACHYLDRYIELTGMSLSEVKEWDLPIMAARLSEDLPISEKEMILKMIGHRLVKE